MLQYQMPKMQMVAGSSTTGGRVALCAARHPMMRHLRPQQLLPRPSATAPSHSAAHEPTASSSAPAPQPQPQSPKHAVPAAPSLLAMLPLAAMSSTGEIYAGLAVALDVYLVALSVRVLLTWFKGIKWTNEPFATLRLFTDPFLNTFRGIIPAIAGIDLSVMLGFFLLSFVRNQLRSMSFSV